MRALIFSDDRGTVLEWHPGDPGSVNEACREFLESRRETGSATLRIEDAETGEALVFLFEDGLVSRVGGGADPRTQYGLAGQDGKHLIRAMNFARGGFTALERHGPWHPDLASVGRARLRTEFDGSVLRRTHPRELRRRLEVLTRVDGREPVTVGGVTHLGYVDGAGRTVNAWLTAGGRGLLVTFEGEADPDPRARAARYDGVPEDLLALVRDLPATGTTANVPHPDGGTLVAATGVFHLSGPWAPADGLVVRLEQDGAGIEATGVDRLLAGFLDPADLTPAVVAEAAPWWSGEQIARGFAASAGPGAEPAEGEPLDPAAVDRFCRIWADSGYNDPWDVHYVLFDGDTVADAGEARGQLLEAVRTLGLVLVDSPPGAPDGEVWVRTDPRIDAELDRWA
ncbi:DUF6357 family protein [Kitasatospora sp. NPDC096147]|uniref:DUF6357 family protein n=1 Tax=Kitasatospora sp. NPDC096147 TaxID=3364093 RepID=UPI003830EEC5